MIQTAVISVCTAIGGGVGYYLDSPWIGTFIGFIVGIGLVSGAIGEVADGVIDCID